MESFIPFLFPASLSIPPSIFECRYSDTFPTVQNLSNMRYLTGQTITITTNMVIKLKYGFVFILTFAILHFESFDFISNRLSFSFLCFFFVRRCISMFLSTCDTVLHYSKYIYYRIGVTRIKLLYIS